MPCKVLGAALDLFIVPDPVAYGGWWRHYTDKPSLRAAHYAEKGGFDFDGNAVTGAVQGLVLCGHRYYDPICLLR